MNIQILEAAQQDLKDGYAFYEIQAPGIGRYFLDSLYSDIDSLSLYAGVHPVKFGRYYQMLSRRFPYAIYYTLNNQTVLVFAVLDCRRNPKRMKDRLR